MKKFRTVLNVFSTILLVATIALVVAVFAIRISGAKPKLMGYYVFNVVSDSMEPELKIDDVILVKECNPSSLHKGDVVTYHGTEGDFAGKDVTHKIIKEPETDSGGTVRIQTKGTKIGAIADPPITGDQVIGKFVRKLHVLGLLYKAFRQWYGLAIFLVLLLALIGKEMFNLARLSQKADELEPLTQEQIKEILEKEKEKEKGKENKEKQ